ncbi:MAG: colicin immunity domain-containing protein [Verrucomicrobiales bacterium]
MSKVAFYQNLISDYLSGQIPVHDFEIAYMNAFKSDNHHYGYPLFDILNEVFTDLDAFQADPEVRGFLEIDEPELRSRLQNSLKLLDNYLLKNH